MIVELLRVECACGLMLPGTFDNHHAAIVAAETAGWLMQSESIGGDQCPRCLGREKFVPPTIGVNFGGMVDALDDARRERDDAIARGVQLWEYAAEADAYRESYEALSDLHQEWWQAAQSALDDICEALRSPHALTGQQIREAVERIVRGRDEARAEIAQLKSLLRAESEQAEGHDIGDPASFITLEVDEATASMIAWPESSVELEEWRREAIESRKQLTTALAELAELRARCRTAAQTLIQEIGAPGPEALTDTARRAVERIRRIRAQRNELAYLVANVRSSESYIGASFDLAVRITEGDDFAPPPWAVERDEADERAAYAGASDLAGLAERESGDE